jgi:hypothetical protein
VCVGGMQDAEVPHTPYKDESDSEEEEEEIAAVEMILETYFMHCDNTYNKLQTLCQLPLPLLHPPRPSPHSSRLGARINICTILDYDIGLYNMQRNHSLLLAECSPSQQPRIFLAQRLGRSLLHV